MRACLPCPKFETRGFKLRRRPQLRGCSGQAAIEYILILSMIVGIMVGVLRPVFERTFAQIQANIEDAASEVLSQSELGIPLPWFSLQGSGFDAGNNPFTGRGGDPNAGGPNGGGNDGDGGGPRDGGGNGPEGTGPTGPRNRPFSGRGRNQDGDSAEEGGGGGQRGRRVVRNSRSGSSGSSGSFESGSSSSSQPLGGEQGAKTSDDETTSGVVGRGRRVTRAQESEQEGSCKDVNLFTLVKIAALLGLLLLGAAVFLTGKGSQGGSD